MVKATPGTYLCVDAPGISRSDSRLNSKSHGNNMTMAQFTRAPAAGAWAIWGFTKLGVQYWVLYIRESYYLGVYIRGPLFS